MEQGCRKRIHLVRLAGAGPGPGARLEIHVVDGLHGDEPVAIGAPERPIGSGEGRNRLPPERGEIPVKLGLDIILGEEVIAQPCEPVVASAVGGSRQIDSPNFLCGRSIFPWHRGHERHDPGDEAAHAVGDDEERG